MALPWDAGFSARVNGRTVEVSEVFGLLSLPLEEGLNAVEIVYRSPGLVAGGVLTGLGLLLCGLWTAFRCRAGLSRRLAAWFGKENFRLFGRAGERAEALLSRMTPAAQKAALVCCALLAAGVFAALYLFPLALNLF